MPYFILGIVQVKFLSLYQQIFISEIAHNGWAMRSLGL